MKEILQSAAETLQTEANAILDQLNFLNSNFVGAVKLIAASKGKLVVTGMGKSGIIGHKIAATMASTGTPGIFMHPGEAFHGDLGMVNPGDVILALSFSGETDEVLKLIPFFKENGNKIIAITGNPNSTLAQHSEVNINIYIDKEACPLSLAPTSSTTVMLAMGDALAISLMKLHDFKEENFARFHPGGSLGKRLLSTVEMVMRTNDLPIIQTGSSLKDIIDAMSQGKLGLALVNENFKTIGIITDGDLRRLLESMGKDAFDLVASQIMTKSPRSISPKATLVEAEGLFNRYKINSLVVVTEFGETVGVVQIYNL